jgi:hypothetical protein
MSWEYEFECDSLSPAISQKAQSFFYCVLCKTLENTLDRDLNMMSVYSSQYIEEVTGINLYSSSIIATPEDDLMMYINDAAGRLNDKVPGIGSPVQVQAGMQTSYNNYHKTARDYSDSLSLNNITRIGLAGMQNVGSGFTNKFRGTSSSPQAECLDDLVDSYNCPEMKLYLDMSKLTNQFGDISEFIKSIQDAISGYASMGCSEEKGISMSGQLGSYIDVMPLNDDYSFDFDLFKDNLDIIPGVSTNLDYVKSTAGDIMDSALGRVEL